MTSEFSVSASSLSKMSSSVNAENVNTTPSTTANSEKDGNVLRVQPRKLKSLVWGHFNRLESLEHKGKYTATCKYCKRNFDGSSTKGTTHLLNHSKTCLSRNNNDIRQAFIGKSVENPKRHVNLECDTRWNSTYDMLVDALELQDGFNRLADLDACFKPYLPSKEEWEMGVKVCKHLKIFKNATDALSGCKYPTSPLYFKFICNIRECLRMWAKSRDEDIAKMASLMQLKFDKYWEECSLVLTIAAILDPRYKMTLVEAAFSNKDDDEDDFFIMKVRNFWEELFYEYDESTSVTSNVDVSESQSSHLEDLTVDENVFPLSARFRQLASQSNVASLPKKSEIELYLEEGLIPLTEPESAFDILSWWKHNGARYPTLSRMARDVLAIPCTTVPSESTFSQARRTIEDTRASLNSDTVEALLCLKDW